MHLLCTILADLLVATMALGLLYSFKTLVLDDLVESGT